MSICLAAYLSLGLLQQAVEALVLQHGGGQRRRWLGAGLGSARGFGVPQRLHAGAQLPQRLQLSVQSALAGTRGLQVQLQVQGGARRLCRAHCATMHHRLAQRL